MLTYDEKVLWKYFVINFALIFMWSSFMANSQAGWWRGRVINHSRNLETERAQDAAIKSSTFNYIKIYDNQFNKFLDGINAIKDNIEKNIKKQIIIESTTEF